MAVGKIKLIQALAAAVAGFEVVPELDVFLVGFPAEKNFTTADDGGEINQATGKVFDKNLAPLKFSEYGLHIGEGTNPLVDGGAAGIAALAGDAAQAFVQAFEIGAMPVEIVEPAPDLREQSTGFIARVVFGETVVQNVKLKTVRGSRQKQSAANGCESKKAGSYFCQVRFL